MTLQRVILLSLAAAILFLMYLFLRRGYLRERTLLRILLLLLSSLLVLGLVVGSIFFPGYEGPSPTGKYTVTVMSLQLTDESREEFYRSDGSPRTLPIDIYYPEELKNSAASAPLFLFSHGGMGIKSSNLTLYKELASHGYVVVSADHPYHALFSRVDGKVVLINSGYMRELSRENSHEDISASLSLFEKWMELRTEDLSFILDQLLQSEDYAMIDPKRTALGGHSLGGSAALAMARHREDIGAVIALESPFMADMLGVEGEEFVWERRPYAAELLLVYSDQGMELLETDHKYRQNRRLMDSTQFFHLEGSNHFTLTDLGLTSPLLSRLLGGPFTLSPREGLEALNRVCLEFLQEQFGQ